MLRGNRYVVLKNLAEKAVRASSDATAMLVSGKSKLDAELRRLRAETGEGYLKLVEELVSDGCSVGERAALSQLGKNLCEVLECALQVAALLRGRAVRVWALFDRVRVSATLTERLLAVVEQLDGGNERSVQMALREFSEVSVRLSLLGTRSLEEVISGEENGAALLLSVTLDRWRSALCSAHALTIGLLAARGI